MEGEKGRDSLNYEVPTKSEWLTRDKRVTVSTSRYSLVPPPSSHDHTPMCIAGRGLEKWFMYLSVPCPTYNTWGLMEVGEELTRPNYGTSPPYLGHKPKYHSHTNIPYLLVSEPDPRKIEKEGLAHRPGWKCTLRPV